MLDIVLQRLDYGARMALPFVTTLLCVFLGAMAWPLPWLGAVAPPLALMTVYYWSIHRPDLFRPWMAFVVGFLNDTVHDLPLGMSALLFVAVQQVILHQRRFFAGHSFFMTWSGFALIAAFTGMAGWLIMSLHNWHLTPAFPVMMQTFLAIIFFPLPCWLLIRLQRAALSQA